MTTIPGAYTYEWTMRAPEIFFQGLYSTAIGSGPTLSVTCDNNSSGRYAWLLPSAQGTTNLRDWPTGPWTAFAAGTITSVVPGSLPSKVRIECQSGTLTCKSTAP
jgi:hypothetical protein